MPLCKLLRDGRYREETRIASVANPHQATPGCHQDSPLLKLPAELRNEIYDYALCDYSECHVCSTPMCEKETPALLNVCRQTRHEISPIICSKTIVGCIEWKEHQSIISMLRAFGTDNCARIRSIRLRCTSFEYSCDVPRFVKNLAEALLSTGVDLERVVYHGQISRKDFILRRFVKQFEEELGRLSGKEIRMLDP